MKKKLTSILLTVAMLCMLIPRVFASNYYDTTGHWAENVIDKWSGYGVVKGYDGQFRPNDNITRAEVAQIMQNIMSYTDTAANMYADIKPTDWYADAILKLVAAGALAGDANGNMNPNQNMTRQDAMTMLCRAMGLNPKSSYTVNYTDKAYIAGYAMDSINALASRGYITGYADGGIHPTSTISRAEFLQIVNNVISIYVTTGGLLSNQSVTGIVMIKASNVNLNNIQAEAVIISPIASGTVDFTNCTINSDVVNHSRNVKVTIDGTAESYHTVDFYVSGQYYAGRYVKDRCYVVPIPSNPVKSGYSFEGWFLTAEAAAQLNYNYCIDLKKTKITTDISLYAGFSKEVRPETYDVTFYVDGAYYATRTVNYNSYIYNMPDDPTPSGSQFKGWFTNATAAKNLDYNYYFDPNNTRIRKNMSLHAGFEAIESPTTYKVVFYVGNNVYATSTAKRYATIDNVPSNPTVSGGEFQGWFTTKEAAEQLNYSYYFNVNTDSVLSDLNLYAGFSQLVSPIKELSYVTINSNYPSVGDVLSATVYPTEAKNGVTYTWYSSSASTGEIQVGEGQTYKVTSADVNKNIKVVATAKDNSGYKGSVSEMTTGAVMDTVEEHKAYIYTEGGGSAYLSSSTATKGQTVYIRTSPMENYGTHTVMCETTSGQRINVEKETTNEYSFVMPDENVYVYVYFEEVVLANQTEEN